MSLSVLTLSIKKTKKINLDGQAKICFLFLLVVYRTIIKINFNH